MFRTYTILFLLLLSSFTYAQPPVGSVYITRNLDERLNTSPGYENHLAIYVGDGYVVESQQGYGVIATPLTTFFARPYHPPKLLQPKTPELGLRAGAVARTYVGKQYGKASSYRLISRLGTPDRMNCVSVICEAYETAAYTKLEGFRKPDDIYWQVEVFVGK